MSCGVGLRAWLRSCIAVAVVYTGSYSSDSTLRLGTFIYPRYDPEKGWGGGGNAVRSGGKKEKHRNPQEEILCLVYSKTGHFV